MRCLTQTLRNMLSRALLGALSVQSVWPGSCGPVPWTHMAQAGTDILTAILAKAPENPEKMYDTKPVALFAFLPKQVENCATGVVS